jgi:hypothetical protein
MYKVIFYKKSIEKGSAPFVTLEEANAWISNIVGKNKWGLPDRWIVEDDLSEEEKLLATNSEVREVKAEYAINHEAVYDEENNVIQEAYDEVVPAVNKTFYFFLAEYTYEIIDLDLDVAYQAKLALENRLRLGKIARACCDEVWDLIAGYNLTRELTLEQIDSMESTFAPIAMALQAKRPDKAKLLIADITPDETLVTQAMIDDVNSIFTKHGL